MQVIHQPMPQLSCPLTGTQHCFTSSRKCSESVEKHIFPKRSLLPSGALRKYWMDGISTCFVLLWLPFTWPFTFGTFNLIAIYFQLEISGKVVQWKLELWGKKTQSILVDLLINSTPREWGLRLHNFQSLLPDSERSRWRGKLKPGGICIQYVICSLWKDQLWFRLLQLVKLSLCKFSVKPNVFLETDPWRTFKDTGRSDVSN